MITTTLACLYAALISCSYGQSDARADLAWAPLGPGLRVVLSAEQRELDYWGEGPGYVDDRLEVKLRAKHGWRIVASVKPIDRPESREYAPDDFVKPVLLVGDFDGDGAKEIAVIRNYHFNSGGPPGDLRVYRYRHRRLVLLGEIESNQGIQVLHLRGSKCTQFVRSYEIGWETCCHAEMPRWPDVYEVCGKRLVQANARFPRFYRKQLREIRELLGHHPVDRELWAYYGYAATYARLRIKPAQVYRAVYRDAVRYARTRPDDMLTDREEYLSQATMLLRWAKENRPFPRANKPFLWFGRYMADDQFPWCKPPKRGKV